MKQFENIFRTFFIVCMLVYSGVLAPVRAQTASRMDSIEVGLITCSPHDEIYSLYGHTALRVHDLKTGMDLVFNYGVFNFHADFFVIRFVFGLTDYELGIAPTAPFCKFYQQWGSQVTEQVLNLTAEEKQKLSDALRINYLPQNRVYRYNYFYDNCSTRPRDMVEACLTGKLTYHPRQDYVPTYRQMVHSHTTGHRWAAFGNDILLGVKSDVKTDWRQQQFLPDNLRYDFDHATVERNGRTEPLVKECREIVAPGVQMKQDGFPLSPLACALILLAVSLGVTAYEYCTKKILKWFDVLLMIFQGLAGCVLTAMIFSQHPTTSFNLQILLLNPLPFFFLYQVAKGRRTRWFYIELVLIILFFAGMFWQDYAEGMEFLALCLLFRCGRHIHKMRATYP